MSISQMNRQQVGSGLDLKDPNPSTSFFYLLLIIGGKAVFLCMGNQALFATGSITVYTSTRNFPPPTVWGTAPTSSSHQQNWLPWLR